MAAKAHSSDTSQTHEFVRTPIGYSLDDLILPPASQRVPRELLCQILEPLRPTFDTCSPPVLGASGFTSRENDFAIYLEDMKTFIALRLVSQIWDAVLAPLIYQDFLIPTRFPVMPPTDFGQVLSLLPTLFDSRVANPSGRVHKLVKFLQDEDGLADTLIHNVKSLVLYDFCHPFSSSAYADETQLITRIIKQFRNSDIRSLHCYGREVYAFRHPSWLEETLPNLHSTIRHLTFDGAERNAISYALVSLGNVIKSLEIRNRSRLWDADYENLSDVAFHLPSETSNLESLRLIHVSTTLSEFRMLLSCIGKKNKSTDSNMRDSPGALTSTLQSLTVTQLFVLNEDPQVGGFYSPLMADEFSRMLDINGIAENLTYLYIGPGLYSMSDAFNVIWRPRTVAEIVKKCHRLVDFSYASIVDEHFIDSLPPQLRHISLALRPSISPPLHVNSYFSSLPKFTEFVRGAVERKMVLESLTILIMDQLQRNPGFWRMSFDEVGELLHVGKPELDLACEEAGIQLSFNLI